MTLSKIIFPIIIFSSIAGLPACKTYTIPVDSFKQQFQGMDSGHLRPVTTQSPFGGRSNYLTNPIDSIFCVDKKGQPAVLLNGPAIEIRFTYEDHKHTVFYFDRMTVDSVSVTGVTSRILGTRKTIPLNSIKKIEVQNGQKKYSYIQ
jgi:hypothetical protein